MKDGITAVIVIEDLTEEEAKKMEEAIRENCKKHGVEIASLQIITKED